MNAYITLISFLMFPILKLRRGIFYMQHLNYIKVEMLADKQKLIMFGSKIKHTKLSFFLVYLHLFIFDRELFWTSILFQVLRTENSRT